MTPEVCEEKVMDVLPELTCTELRNLCLEVGLTVPEGIKEKKGKLFQFIMRYLLQLETQEEDGGKAKFVQIYQYLITNITPNPEDEEKDVKPSPDDVKTTTDLDTLGELAKSLVLSGIDAKPAVDLASILQGLNSKTVPTKPVHVKPAMVMKDLKMTGVIGSESEKEKDKMTFSSLCYQIRNAQKLGHSEQTICNAILTAISPTNHLKTFFEMRPNLTIKGMLSKLKNLYKEKDSTSTLMDLSNAAQTTSETCLDYCTRLMCLRDKVILLSVEEGCPLDMSGLSKRLIKSFFVGMRNANVRNELRESCKNLYKGNNNEDDDDELMALVTEAMANETERQERLSTSKKAEVLMMQTNITNKENNKTASNNIKKEKSNPISQIEDLKLEQANQGQAIAAVVAQLTEIKHVLVGDKSNSSTPLAPVMNQQPSTSASQQALLLQQLEPLLKQLEQSNPTVVAQLRSSLMGDTSAFVAPIMHQQTPPLSLLAQTFTPPSHVQQPPAHPGPPPPPPQQNQNSQNQQRYIPPQRRKCANCERENKFRCFCCFHCGSANHQVQACPTKNM